MKRRRAVIESLSKGLEILEEFGEKNSYDIPLCDTIRDFISELQEEKDEDGN